MHLIIVQMNVANFADFLLLFRTNYGSFSPTLFETIASKYSQTGEVPWENEEKKKKEENLFFASAMTIGEEDIFSIYVFFSIENNAKM